MANARSSGTNYEYATVDTLPGAAGYFTNSICPRDKAKTDKVKKIFFSIRETNADISAAPSDLSTVTVVLQYKCGLRRVVSCYRQQDGVGGQWQRCRLEGRCCE